MKHNWLLEILTKSGYKATAPRQMITEHLIKQEGLFCPLTIAKKLPHIDTVSIYRTLERLKNLGSINPVINIDGQQFYEKNEKNDHHHHIICRNCKRTRCVECGHTKIPKVPGFSDVRHSFILTGLCMVCKKKK